MRKTNYTAPTLGIIELKLISQILTVSGGVQNYATVEEPEE